MSFFKREVPAESICNETARVSTPAHGANKKVRSRPHAQTKSSPMRVYLIVVACIVMLLCHPVVAAGRPRSQSLGGVPSVNSVSVRPKTRLRSHSAADRFRRSGLVHKQDRIDDIKETLERVKRRNQDKMGWAVRSDYDETLKKAQAAEKRRLEGKPKRSDLIRPWHSNPDYNPQEFKKRAAREKRKRAKRIAEAKLERAQRSSSRSPSRNRTTAVCPTPVRSNRSTRPSKRAPLGRKEKKKIARYKRERKERIANAKELKSWIAKAKC